MAEEVRLTLRLLASRPAGLSLRSISKMPAGILSNYVLISNIHPFSFQPLIFSSPSSMFPSLFAFSLTPFRTPFIIFLHQLPFLFALTQLLLKASKLVSHPLLIVFLLTLRDGSIQTQTIAFPIQISAHSSCLFLIGIGPTHIGHLA